MNVKRAREIVQSKDTITVTYQGTKVWIDGVDENSATARIHVENNPDEEKVVAVDLLQEQ
jgi:small acid-soluble spore protein H (minor)